MNIIHLQNPNPKLIFQTKNNQENEFESSLLSGSNNKYQDITYYKCDNNEIIKDKDKIHIDFLKAMHEMEGLDWTTRNYIGFSNNRTRECVQFKRLDKEKWYAESPIIIGTSWNGYSWISESDGKSVSNMLRLFFEEVPWFEMIRWKMTRLKK